LSQRLGGPLTAWREPCAGEDGMRPGLPATLAHATELSKNGFLWPFLPCLPKPARGCPRSIAGRSLRASSPPLSRLRLRYAIHGCARLHTPAHGARAAPSLTHSERRRRGVAPTVEPAYLTSGAMDGAAQANPSEPEPGGRRRTSGETVRGNPEPAPNAIRPPYRMPFREVSSRSPAIPRRPRSAGGGSGPARCCGRWCRVRLPGASGGGPAACGQARS